MKEKIHEMKTYSDGRTYIYTEYDKKLKDGTPYSIKSYLPTEDEIQLNAEEERIKELRLLISDMKLLDMDATEEQDELKSLLGLE